MSELDSLLALAHAQAIELSRMARDEDLGTGDMTTALIDAERSAELSISAREAGVIAGCEIVQVILAAYDDRLAVEWKPPVTDGFVVDKTPMKLAALRGPLKSLLAVERTLLNFLQRLSGIATLTRNYVRAIEGTPAKIYDTRKTTPGWRALEKYAVRCGGGRNHRMGLYDAVLLKDNHLAGIDSSRLAGLVFEMLNRAAEMSLSPAFVEVEADTLEQVGALLKVVGIDVVLLDNFSLTDLRRAVHLRDELGLRGKVQLEASGGVQLNTVRSIAETGVDRISVGAITHSAPALDLGLDA